MDTYSIWKLIHVIGLIIFVAGFSILLFNRDQSQAKKVGSIFHGVGFLIILASAFGLAGALDLYKDFPAWAKFKTYILVLLGIMPFFMRKFPARKTLIAMITFALIVGAVSLAIFKP